MFKKLPFPFSFIISLLVITLPTFATTGVSPGAGMANLPSPESIGIGEELFDNMRVNKNNNDLPVNPCIPSVYYPCYVYLTNVTIGTINNNSGCDGSYSDFSAQSTDMEIGSTQSISFSTFNYGQYISVYIDVNNNGSLSDPGEQVVNNFLVPASTTGNTTFTLPGNAVPGTYTMRVMSTYEGDGFASNPCGGTYYGEGEDYTLIVTCATTPLTFYNDADSDGFGDPATSESALCPSTGFIMDNTDCDDTDNGVNPATTEISENMIDDDCDGKIDELLYCIPYVFGACSESSISIYQVAMGTIDNASTCNTTGYEDFTSLSTTVAAGQDISFSATLNFLGFTYSGFSAFIDFNQDGDFYDSGEIVFASIVYSENNVTSGTITIPFAIPPGNYTIRLATDLNQYNDPCYSSYGEVEDYTLTITCPISSVTYYADADGDGFGDPNASISETGCAPAGYVLDNTDCDDSNATYHELIYWYLDADGDGYYSESVYNCSPPEGEGWSNQYYAYDCDDTNAAYYYYTFWYYDGDGDGYHYSYYYDCSPPEVEGWTNQTNGNDCDDNNAALNYSEYWYFDGDGDGYYGNYLYTCIPPEGEGWTNQTIGDDCDDNNAALNYSVYWYFDGDGDGYYGNYLYTCIPPEGEGWSNYSNGYDCDDTNAAYVYSNNWYYDGDGDGYYGNFIYACTPPEGEGWSIYGFLQDCDDNNPIYQQSYPFYLDADGDDYYSEYVYACFAPGGAGWSAEFGFGDGDCDDSNAAIHPGPETLGNEIDDNCDGLIDVLIYCTPSGYTDCNYNAHINNVELGTMSNASGCDFGYMDYSQFVVSANAGDEITYSVSISPSYAVLEIYIDYNMNGIFTDQGEFVIYDYNYQYLVPFTGTIALPSGLAEGSYRIRIKADYGYYYNDPCNYHYGEIEDYTINIGTVCADIDLDGYTDQACGGNDCDDTNNAINPAATEICNSGVDDDCNIATADPISCNCAYALSTAIVTPSTTERMADIECSEGGWTHYFDEEGSNHYILLSIKKGGQSIGSIGDGTFAVRQKGSAGVTIIPNNYPFNYCNTLNWHVMNRYWEVEPTIQPTTGVNVRFYYTTNDFDALVLALANATPPRTLTSHEQMLFYKVEDLLGNAYDINPVNGHTNIPIASGYGADGYYEYQHGQEANTYAWHHEIFNTDYHYGEYVVSKFSGGGGGGGNVGGAFPIELLYFTGRPAATANILTWATATERNNQFQIIERSPNGSDDWMEIGRVTGAGNSVTEISYEFADENPPTKAYYHLRAVDFDGAEQFSEVIYIERPSEVLSILTAFPVPVENDLHLRVNTPLSGEVTILLHDILGSVVYKNETTLSKGVNEITINMHDLPSGTYQVRLENKSSRVMKIVNRIKA